MIERIYILSIIVIIKSEVWTITHCLGLGHETMVCAVCLSIFFVIYLCINFYAESITQKYYQNQSHNDLKNQEYIFHKQNPAFLCQYVSMIPVNMILMKSYNESQWSAPPCYSVYNRTLFTHKLLVMLLSQIGVFSLHSTTNHVLIGPKVAMKDTDGS